MNKLVLIFLFISIGIFAQDNIPQGPEMFLQNMDQYGDDWKESFIREFEKLGEGKFISNESLSLTAAYMDQKGLSGIPEELANRVMEMVLDIEKMRRQGVPAAKLKLEAKRRAENFKQSNIPEIYKGKGQGAANSAFGSSRGKPGEIRPGEEHSDQSQGRSDGNRPDG